MKKFFIAFISLWLTHLVIIKVSKAIFSNIYILDSLFFFYPIILAAGLIIYFLKHNKKQDAMGMITAFVIYYPIFLLTYFWGLGEGFCTSYFFNLLNNCN